MMPLADVAASELQKLKADADAALETANADAWQNFLRAVAEGKD
jgi:hypothetical protein